MLLMLIGWVGKAYLADVLASRPTVGNLERAVKLDPSDADYHMRLVAFTSTAPLISNLKRPRTIFAALRILIPMTLKLGSNWRPRWSSRAE